MRKMYEDGVGMGTDVMGMGWGRGQMGRGWGWDGDGCDVMGMGWEWEWGETCGNGVGMGRTSCPRAALYSMQTHRIYVPRFIDPVLAE